MSDFLSIFSIGLFQNTLRTATPVVLAALGILMTDHVGIMNIGMDGMMLTTAFFAVLGSVFLGGWLGGLALAMAVGLLMGAFFGLFVVKFKSETNGSAMIHVYKLIMHKILLTPSQDPQAIVLFMILFK